MITFGDNKPISHVRVNHARALFQIKSTSDLPVGRTMQNAQRCQIRFACCPLARVNNKKL